MNAPFLVVDSETKRCVYEADTISQAKGYTDRRRKPSTIYTPAEVYGAQWVYQVCVIDATTGKVHMRGPIVDIESAPDFVGDLRIAILPVLDAAQKSEVLT